MVMFTNPRAREIDLYVNNYGSALRFLRGKNQRKLANNTFVRQEDEESVSVVLHRTPIVTYYSTGLIVLRSGGYRSKTTAQRINQLLPPGWSLSRWKLKAPDGETQEFFDGIAIHAGLRTHGSGSRHSEPEENPRRRGRKLTVPEQHQLKIAQQTLRMNDAMVGVMGGMTKEEARVIIARLSSVQMDEPDRPGHQPNPRRKDRSDPADKREKSYRYGDTTYYLEKVPFSGHWLVKAGGTALGGPSPSYGIALANFYAVTGREGQPWVDVWEERDNLQITLYFGTKNDPNESEEIATWTDDDARSMFTDGFFKSGKNVKASVISYAEDVGLL